MQLSDPIQYCSDKIYFKYKNFFDKLFCTNKLSDKDLDRMLTISNYSKNFVNVCIVITKTILLLS